jgi:putative heme-binding domain-containing protein
VAGDATEGQRLFYGEGGCSNCHAIRGQGGRIAPDLSDAGSLTLAELRESILEPSKEIVLGFAHVTATFRDGTILDGVAKGDSDYSIQILDTEGKLHRIDKSNLQEVTFHRGSLMPGDIGTRLGMEKVEDILAFLAHQVTRPGQADAHPGRRVQ